ncbi:MAG TPA: PAS domain-containing protein [Candidatus Thermoplasmatota archaeon]
MVFAAATFVLVGLMFAVLGTWGNSAQATVARVVLFSAYSAGIAFLLFRAGRRNESAHSSCRLLLDRLPVGAALLDGERRIRYANATFCELVQRSASDVLGVHAPVLVDPRDREALGSRIGRAAAGLPAAVRVRLHRAEGPGVPVFLSAVALAPAGRGAATALIVHEDSSLLRARGEAERNKSFSDFVVDAVSHDLANALTVAWGHAQLAKRAVEAGGGPAARSADMAAQAAERAAELVVELRLLAQGEAGGAPRHVRPLGAIVERAVGGARTREGGTVLVTIPTGAVGLPVVATPSAHLALQKVIEEASHQPGAGSEAVKVQVNPPLGPPGGQVVTVRVRGGLSPLPEADLMASMSDLTGAMAEDVPRHGLKLALAAAVARANGWTLRAYQEWGVAPATMFELEVPLSSASPSEVSGAVRPLAVLPRRVGGGDPPLRS